MGDIRGWKLAKYRTFSCKSYRSYLCSKSDVSYFQPDYQNWKAKVHPKVQVLAWLVVSRKVNT